MVSVTTDIDHSPISEHVAEAARLSVKPVAEAARLSIAEAARLSSSGSRQAFGQASFLIYPMPRRHSTPLSSIRQEKHPAAAIRLPKNKPGRLVSVGINALELTRPGLGGVVVHRQWKYIEEPLQARF
jgi:hypothetical protein